MSAVLDKMAQEVEAKLQKVNDEIKSKVSDLVEERDELTAALKKFKKGAKNGVSTSAVSDEQVVDAVGKLTSAPGAPAAKSTDVAKALGVSGQNVARKLSKLAGAGVISGNKDDGYSV